MRGVAWSSGQRRSLSLQGSRDRIMVFLFLLFISKNLREKKRKSTKGSHNEESRRREQREEEEKPAGVSGKRVSQKEIELRDPGDSCVSRVS